MTNSGSLILFALAVSSPHLLLNQVMVSFGGSVVSVASPLFLILVSLLFLGLRAAIEQPLFSKVWSSAISSAFKFGLDNKGYPRTIYDSTMPIWYDLASNDTFTFLRGQISQAVPPSSLQWHASFPPPFPMRSDVKVMTVGIVLVWHEGWQMLLLWFRRKK